MDQSLSPRYCASPGEKEYLEPKEDIRHVKQECSRDFNNINVPQIFPMLFYKLRLLTSIASKKVPTADEPKNRQRVVRGISILSSREEILLLTTE